MAVRSSNPSRFMNAAPAILATSQQGGTIRGGMSPLSTAVVLNARPELAGVNALTGAVNAAKQFNGATLLDVARQSCEASGIPTLYRSPSEIFTNALGTADFKQALADVFVTGVTFGAADVATGVIAVTSEPRQVKDFTENKRSRYSATGPGLKKKEEGGEFEYGVVGAESETYEIGNYGRIWNLSIESLFATQDALPSTGVLAGRAVLLHQREMISNLLINNAAMSDTVPLFHSTHANVTGPHAKLDVGALDAARKLMRRQVDVATGQQIDIEPALLVVPPEYETHAEQVLAALTHFTVDEVNPFAGKLKVVVEQHLPAGYAYVFAAPGAYPVIERAFVNGSAVPDIQSWLDPTCDVFYNRVALRWGAGVVDYRGAVRIEISG